MASRLADDIMNGRTDMGSVNLSDIGKQVLDGCNEGEMDTFANNIESLLPALQHMGPNMPGLANMMAGAVGQMKTTD